MRRSFRSMLPLLVMLAVMESGLSLCFLANRYGFFWRPLERIPAEQLQPQAIAASPWVYGPERGIVYCDVPNRDEYGALGCMPNLYRQDRVEVW